MAVTPPPCPGPGPQGVPETAAFLSATVDGGATALRGGQGAWRPRAVPASTGAAAATGSMAMPVAATVLAPAFPPAAAGDAVPFLALRGVAEPPPWFETLQTLELTRPASFGPGFDVLLDLGEEAAGRASGPRVPHRWTLVDGRDRLLQGPAAWQAASTDEDGLRIRLLQAAAGGWHVRRELHLADLGTPALDPGMVQRACAELVHQALTDLRFETAGLAEAFLGGALVTPRPALPGGGGGLFDRLRAAWRRALRRQRARWLTEHWRIGVIDEPIHHLLTAGRMPPVRWLTPPEREGYWADPFGMPGRTDLVFCERYDERTGIGRLQRLRLDADGALGDPVELPVGRRHASFPNVFAADGKVYGIAETCDDRKCVLHEVRPDGSWVPLSVLLSGVAAADPTVFRHEGRWWLAYTDADRGPWDNLCLRHAERLEGPWTAHANNPVKVDAAGARMAGAFFEHEGRLYRPGQDCRGAYGSAISLYRVESLGPHQYHETLVRHLAPGRVDAGLDGVHTVSAWGSRTLVDAKRLTLNLHALRAKLRRRLTQLASGAEQEAVR